MPKKPPKLRRHSSGRGTVRLNGIDVYLGDWPKHVKDPPAEVRRNYHATISEWEANGRQLPESLRPANVPDVKITLVELARKYLRHALDYYTDASGQVSNELAEYVASLRPAIHLYAREPAESFGPARLKTVRNLMVQGYPHPEFGQQAGLARKTVNDRIRRIVRVFRWAASEDLIDAGVWHALKSVEGLKKGRSGASEYREVPPVDLEIVYRTLPHLSEHIRGAILFQRFTGTRPTEALTVTLECLDRTGPIWLYRPKKHKTSYLDKSRVIAIGQNGQSVLFDYIKIRCPVCHAIGRPPRLRSSDYAVCGQCLADLDSRSVCGPFKREEWHSSEESLFNPVDSTVERAEDLRAKRKTRVQPSQANRKKAKPDRKPGQFYGHQAYARAIARACEVHSIPRWHPNQLRHTHGTEVRKLFGLEGAQVALGHSQANVTQIYAERDRDLARRIAEKIG